MRKNSLLKYVLEKDRKIIQSDIFGEGTKVSLLHFLGAELYLITDFGAIWHRDRIFPNQFKRVPKGYLPLTIKDRDFPYPWVLLPTSSGKLWLPVNQLLGWAFDPPCSEKKRYFLSEGIFKSPCILQDFKWTDKLPKYEGESLYINFVNSLYD